MILTKIMDWMSSNQNFDGIEDGNSDRKFGRSGRDEPFSLKSKATHGIRSSCSLGKETSVIEFSSSTDLADDFQRRLEASGVEPNDARICGADENMEDFDCSFGGQKHCGKHPQDSTNGSNTSHKIRTENNSSPLEYNQYSDNISLSPFCKDILELKGLPSDATRNRRSIFTQTDRKRRHFPKNRVSCSESENRNRAPQVGEGRTENLTLSSFMRDDSGGAFNPAVYGTLFVLGCNGNVPLHMVGKIDNKFVLRKRRKANGLKEAFSYTSPTEEPLSISPAKHFISYALPHNKSVVVAYKHDKLTDMFQIGRCEESPLDFRVSDVNQSDKARNGVSRFACRIVVHRERHEARVYAAAFDSSDAIFLGESGITSNHTKPMDGFTTNGVLIMHPIKGVPGVWREVSVCGYIYPLRSPKMDAARRPRIHDETNILRDGTVIDLCGVTLVWRTPEGLIRTPTDDHLRNLQNTLHKSIPECKLPTRSLSPTKSKATAKTKAYVYLSCGHVIGLAVEELPKILEGWSCPVCRVVGPLTELTLGFEPGFYMDEEFATHAFKPCGHVASLKTVEYWSSIKIPDHRDIHDSFCPFCRTKLNHVVKFIKLVLRLK